MPIVAALGIATQMTAFWFGIRRARAISARAHRYERRHEPREVSILILGDSTGVGVGVDKPEQSIAGLLAADYPDADIVNVSESGARLVDAIAQAGRCRAAGWQFDVAILHIGGNDIVRATPPTALFAGADRLLTELSTLARRTVWLGPPDLGIAPLFPVPYSWILSSRSRVAISIFARSAERHGAAYIDFSAPAHVARLRRSRRQHFAVDGFHPSAASYRYGYAVAREKLGLPLPGA